MPESRRGEALLFAAALALRIGWALEMSRLPFFDLPTSDSLFYARQAAQIASGHLVGSELSYPSSPLYPYLIAPFFLLSGRAVFGSIYLVQAILDAVHAVLLKRIAGSLFGRRAGWIASGAWAAYGLAVFFTADLMESTAAAFLASLSLYLLLPGRRGVARPDGVINPVDAPHGDSALRWGASGACLAGAALLRPHFLPLIPLAALAAGLLAAREARGRSAAACLLGASLLLGLSLARNEAVSGESILVSPYSGLNAYLGNRRGADGYLSFPKGVGLRNDVDLKEAAHAYPESIEGRPLRESEVSGFWWRETAREVAADPVGFARLLGRKLVLFWSSWEAPNHLDFYFFRGSSIALSLAVVPFGLMAPLALAGLAFAATRVWRDPRVIVVASLSALYAVSCAIFFVADRFRLPATGWIFVLGAGALDEILRRASAAQRARALGPPALALALGVALHSPAPRIHGVREHVMVSAALAGRGRIGEAEGLLRRAVAIDPSSAVARFNLGRLLASIGRKDEARGELLEAARLSPDFPAAQSALGDLAIAGGTEEDRAEARRRWEAALAIEPYGREASRLRSEIDALGTPPATSPDARR